MRSQDITVRVEVGIGKGNKFEENSEAPWAGVFMNFTIPLGESTCPECEKRASDAVSRALIEVAKTVEDTAVQLVFGHAAKREEASKIAY